MAFPDHSSAAPFAIEGGVPFSPSPGSGRLSIAADEFRACGILWDFVQFHWTVQPATSLNETDGEDVTGVSSLEFGETGIKTGQSRAAACACSAVTGHGGIGRSATCVSNPPLSAV
jgi:hypothetical protein